MYYMHYRENPVDDGILFSIEADDTYEASKAMLEAFRIEVTTINLLNIEFLTRDEYRIAVLEREVELLKEHVSLLANR